MRRIRSAGKLPKMFIYFEMLSGGTLPEAPNLTFGRVDRLPLLLPERVP